MMTMKDDEQHQQNIDERNDVHFRHRTALIFSNRHSHCESPVSLRFACFAGHQAAPGGIRRDLSDSANEWCEHSLTLPYTTPRASISRLGGSRAEAEVASCVLDSVRSKGPVDRRPRSGFRPPPRQRRHTWPWRRSSRRPSYRDGWTIRSLTCPVISSFDIFVFFR